MAAVCHGPALVLCSPETLLKTLTWNCSSGLIQGKDSHGKSIFEGRRSTALSNAEEAAHGYTAEVGDR